MEEKVNREHKDRLFCFIFGREENKGWTLSLYNAVNGTGYDNPDDIEITTMEDTVYMGMKNDVSFIVGSQISLYEHQGTYNPNMPVRQLMYLGRQYDKYIKKTRQNVYGSKLMTLPVPRLAVFYNGIDKKTDRILKLSDSFPKDSDAARSDVEVQVHMYNIRPQYDSDLLSECRPLSEYSWFIEEIRKNRETMGIEQAVDKAIYDMPTEFEIRDFLIGNKSEVRNMCLTEYDEAETMEMFREEGKEEERSSRIARMLQDGKSVEAIVDFCGYTHDEVREVEDSLLAAKLNPSADDAGSSRKILRNHAEMPI